MSTDDESSSPSPPTLTTKTSKRKRRRGGGGGCYHCGSLTHRGKACPEVICRHCGGMGHDVGGCPDYQQQQQQQQQASPATITATTNNNTTTTTTTTLNPNAMHFKMYKPVKVLSQFVFSSKRKKGKGLLGDFHEFPPGTMAIGRLDADSEGLLLLTRDGKTSARYTSSKIQKEYHVKVDGIVTQSAVERLRGGVEIKLPSCTTTGGGGEPYYYKTLPCEARIVSQEEGGDDDGGSSSSIPPSQQQLRFGGDGEVRHRRHHRPTSWISITIREGKFRQVRKMTAVVGFPTLRLIRVRIGEIRLEGLAVGQVAEVGSL
jgi:23S rRNA pseudouridine2457 synthase